MELGRGRLYNGCLNLSAHNLPVAQRHHPIHPAREIRVMCGDQRGQALTAHLFQQFSENAIGCSDIQIAGRFIRQ